MKIESSAHRFEKKPFFFLLHRFLVSHLRNHLTKNSFRDFHRLLIDR